MTTNPIEAKRYTVDDLLVMPDDGKRYELINGEIVEMGTSSQKHSTLGAFTAELDESGTLDASNVIPGFKIELIEMFAQVENV